MSEEIKKKYLSKSQQEQLEMLHKLPRTWKQLEASRESAYKTGKLPKTQKQIEACRKIGLNSKGRPHPYEGNVFGDDIIEHHNDGCHGRLRPDDVTYMMMSEHSRLHSKLRYKHRKIDKGRFICNDT